MNAKKTAAADNAAEVQADENVSTETTAVTTTEAPAAETAGSTETTGTRARRAIMLKQFLPNPDWINVNVVAGGKGTKAVIGRIFGLATGYEDKQNTLPDGSIAASIFVKGVFQSESYLDGELGEASGVYFPMAYAEKIKAVLEMGDVKTVEVDCDIGLEATGKTIPYEWVVVAFREGKEMDALKRIRGTRGRPQNVVTLPDGTAKALAAPAETKALPAA